MIISDGLVGIIFCRRYNNNNSSDNVKVTRKQVQRIRKPRSNRKLFVDLSKAVKKYIAPKNDFRADFSHLQLILVKI